ncbi:hypothetical protein [Listeria welshimeri]|nr:hypothetical protein [Listeria innocua]EKG7760589.1 hypothetical protein [Listeria innocua]EKG7922711.1 hypothetical protein [Listeria innocua]EKY3975856.1 hypothetical protein [Listeria innocua]
MNAEMWVLLGTLTTAFLAYKGTAKKSSSEMESVYVKEMKSIVEEYKEQAEKLKIEVKLLQQENREVREKNEQLLLENQKLKGVI